MSSIPKWRLYSARPRSFPMVERNSQRFWIGTILRVYNSRLPRFPLAQRRAPVSSSASHPMFERVYGVMRANYWTLLAESASVVFRAGIRSRSRQPRAWSDGDRQAKKIESSSACFDCVTTKVRAPYGILSKTSPNVLRGPSAWPRALRGRQIGRDWVNHGRSAPCDAVFEGLR